MGVTPPVSELPLAPELPPEFPEPPAPAPAAMPVEELLPAEHEASAKKKRPQIHVAVGDFMLLLWLFPLRVGLGSVQPCQACLDTQVSRK